MTGAFTVDLTNLADLAAPFPPSDIEWRIGQSGKKGDGSVWAKAFAYITNRAIMQRLDDVVGAGNWRNEYRDWLGGNILCGIAIKVDGEWVTKWDGSEPPETEPVKGGLSAAMKRAAVQWGIGRYLYDLPEGWCKVVEKGVRGANYASGKTKQGERYDFYWLPPDLPQWAMPSETGELPTSDDLREASEVLGLPAWNDAERQKLERSLNGKTRDVFRARLGKIKAELAKRELGVAS